LFERSERLLFEHAQEVDAQGVVDRVTSISFIASAPADVRADVERRVRALVADATPPVRLPYMTELYVAYAA
jgi:hypothetical protein